MISKLFCTKGDKGGGSPLSPPTVPKVNSLRAAYYPLPHRYKVNLLRTGGGGGGGGPLERLGPENTLQRQNTENSKQIFPAKELHGYSPSFYIHVSVSDLYIPVIGLPILLQENRCSNVGYIDRSQTHECGKWD
jgi:hypothetical protein